MADVGLEVKPRWRHRNAKALVLIILALAMPFGLLGDNLLGWVGFIWLWFDGAFFVMGLFLAVEPLARWWIAEHKVKSLFAQKRIPAVHDVFVIEPGSGRRAQLDHVAFIGNKLAVIETKGVEGLMKPSGRSGLLFLLRGKEGISTTAMANCRVQALRGREILASLYPYWSGKIVGFTVFPFGNIHHSMAEEQWLGTLAELEGFIDKFSEAGSGRLNVQWKDVERSLKAQRQTHKELWAFRWKCLRERIDKLPEIDFLINISGYNLLFAMLVLLARYFPATNLWQHLNKL